MSLILLTASEADTVTVTEEVVFQPFEFGVGDTLHVTTGAENTREDAPLATTPIATTIAPRMTARRPTEGDSYPFQRFRPVRCVRYELRSVPAGA